MSHSMRHINDLVLRAKVIEILITTALPYVEIAKAENIGWHTVKYICDHFIHPEAKKKRMTACYSRSKIGDKNPMKDKTKELHHLYGKRWGKLGFYPTQLKPEWFTGRVDSPRAFTAHIWFCEQLGITELPKGFLVHHIDGNPANDDPKNYALVSEAAHRHIHCRENRLRENNINKINRD